MKLILIFTFFLLPFSLAYGGQAPPGQVITLPLKTYAAGTYNIPETSIPKVSTMDLKISRASWTDPAVFLRFQVDLSPDSGKTWKTGSNNQGWCGFTSRGGSMMATDSTLQCICAPQYDCDPTSSNNRVRGVVTITGGSLTTSGVIEIR